MMCTSGEMLASPWDAAVNVGFSWLRRSAGGTGMVKEDYLLINLGMTFNERWFVKYKIE